MIFFLIKDLKKSLINSLPNFIDGQRLFGANKKVSFLLAEKIGITLPPWLNITKQYCKCFYFKDFYWLLYKHKLEQYMQIRFASTT